MTDNEYRSALNQVLIDESQGVYNPVTPSQYRYVSQSLVDQSDMGQYQGGYDEEEAIRIATMNSLQDQFNAYQRDRSERRSAPSQDPCAEPVREDSTPASSHRDIIIDQDRAYQDACEEHDRRTREAESQHHFEENEKEIAEQEQQSKEAEVMRLYYGLPPEPQTGTTVAVMSNGERLVRKFSSDEKAGDIYIWIAGQSVLADAEEKLFLDEFELRMPGGIVVDPNQTLEQQGLEGRVMVQVHML